MKRDIAVSIRYLSVNFPIASLLTPCYPSVYSLLGMRLIPSYLPVHSLLPSCLLPSKYPIKTRNRPASAHGNKSEHTGKKRVARGEYPQTIPHQNLGFAILHPAYFPA
nr:MAG TPA: hypothetical protein [Caudoviricetes sp.]